MYIFKVKYFVFSEPVVAIVGAESQEEALEILESRCAEDDNFTLREIHQYEENAKGVLLSVFT